MKALRRYIKHGDGAAAVEFALIGFPLILLLLGLIEFGRALHIRTSLDAAADRGQRVILMDPTASAETIEAEIRRSLNIAQPGLLAISYGTQSSSSIDYRSVTLVYQMDLLLPAPLGGSIPIGSTRLIVISSP